MAKNNDYAWHAQQAHGRYNPRHGYRKPHVRRQLGVGPRQRKFEEKLKQVAAGVIGALAFTAGILLAVHDLVGVFGHG